MAEPRPATVPLLADYFWLVVRGGFELTWLYSCNLVQEHAWWRLGWFWRVGWQGWRRRFLARREGRRSRFGLRRRSWAG